VRSFDDAARILETTRLVDRFLDFVRFDTQSHEESETWPSTATQLELGRHLVRQLQDLGLTAASLDENGYVVARLEGTAPGTMGLIAHLDTAPAFTGRGVQPRLHRGYDGSPLRLDGDVTIDPADNPYLLECIGDTIITSDGTTLLGADDKAGIAAILATLEVLVADPGLVRPTLAICFSPDEEIGRGAHRFPLEAFDAPVAFTVDGGYVGELNVETFSADRATVSFEGVAVHPGEAKGKMVNALTYLGKFLSRLPMAEAPECTQGREGFFHPTDVHGDAAACRLDLILRDFDAAVLARRGARVQEIARGLVAEEPRLRVDVDIQPQYRNMHDQLVEHPRILDQMTRAVRAAGVTPRIEAVRGGTDGSQLTAKGLPTPNIFAGGLNFHGPREWVSTRAMALSVCTLLNLVQIYAEEA
jgi:tripeptide aminopeptidase